MTHKEMTHGAKARTGTLDDIAGADHVFSIIAMDQRNTLRRMFAAAGHDASDEDLRTAKADVARILTPGASGLLSDPTYGVPAITAAGALAPACGLLVAAEPAERRTYQGEPRTHRDPALNAQWVLDQGGDAYKFFLQLRADRPAPRKPPKPKNPRKPKRPRASQTWSPRGSPSSRRSSTTAAPLASPWLSRT